MILILPARLCGAPTVCCCWRVHFSRRIALASRSWRPRAGGPRSMARGSTQKSAASYRMGTHFHDLYRGAALYVKQMLKGARPAKALGLMIPPSVLGRAHQVIELMDRRAFITFVGTSVLAAPLTTPDKKGGKVGRIGYLAPGTATTSAGLRQAFNDGLRDHGWIEEKNVAIEYRWAGDAQPTLHAMAAELARLPLDLIFAANTPAALAMKRTGKKLPVGFAQVREPIAFGLGGRLG